MPKILKHKILLNNQELFFFAPENDSTIPGTLAGLKENNWKLEKTNFQDGDYFVDIGCNVGLISLIVAKLKPNINVLSYDPNPIAIDWVSWDVCPAWYPIAIDCVPCCDLAAW